MRAFFILATCVVLAGCGVKPGQVSAPEDADPAAFPKTYPDISTDPAPKDKE